MYHTFHPGRRFLGTFTELGLIGILASRTNAAQVLPVGGSKSLMPAAAALNGIGILGSGTFPGSGAVAGSPECGCDRLRR